MLPRLTARQDSGVHQTPRCLRCFAEKTFPTGRIGQSLASRGTEADLADRLGAHRRGMRARIHTRTVRTLPLPDRETGHRPLMLDSRCPRVLFSAAAAVSAALRCLA